MRRITIGKKRLKSSFLCDQAQATQRLKEKSNDFLVYILLLHLATLLYFLKTSFTNPGNIPKIRYSENDFIPRRSIRSMVDKVRDNDIQGKLPLLTYIVSGSEMTKYKRCIECFIYRPPRTVHCKLCSFCVLEFDHHCVWMANCIGLRNYGYFLTFLASSLIEALSIFFMAVYHLSCIQLISSNQGKIALISITVTTIIPITLYIAYLCIFHVKLVITDQKTIEKIQARPREFLVKESLIKRIRRIFFMNFSVKNNIKLKRNVVSMCLEDFKPLETRKDQQAFIYPGEVFFGYKDEDKLN